MAQEKARLLEQGFASNSKKKLDSTHEALSTAASEIMSLKDRNSTLTKQIEVFFSEGRSLKETLHDCQEHLIASETRLQEAQDEHRRTVKEGEEKHKVELAEVGAEAQKKVRNKDDDAASLAARCADWPYLRIHQEMALQKQLQYLAEKIKKVPHMEAVEDLNATIGKLERKLLGAEREKQQAEEVSCC